MIRIVCLIIGYVFGLFQTAYFLGKIYGIDIRQHGSGNSGTTNMLRTLGLKAGLLTFAGDVLKCVAAVWLVRVVFASSYGDILPLLSMYTAAGVILGHNYPFFLHFQGGKGMAATAGFVFTQPPVLIGICAALFFGTFFLTHYVSLGSILVNVGLLILVPILGQKGFYGMDQAHLLEMYAVLLFLVLLSIWRHRENIRRLLSGTERKTYLSGRHKKKENE